jgi:hypothetical protein
MWQVSGVPQKPTRINSWLSVLAAGYADPFSDSHARLCLFCLTEEDSLRGSPYYRVYYDR